MEEPARVEAAASGTIQMGARGFAALLAYRDASPQHAPPPSRQPQLTAAASDSLPPAPGTFPVQITAEGKGRVERRREHGRRKAAKVRGIE
jgi:hypothetical protein